MLLLETPPLAAKSQLKPHLTKFGLKIGQEWGYDRNKRQRRFDHSTKSGMCLSQQATQVTNFTEEMLNSSVRAVI